MSTASPLATVASGQSSGPSSVDDTTVIGMVRIRSTHGSRTSDSSVLSASICHELPERGGPEDHAVLASVTRPGGARAARGPACPSSRPSRRRLRRSRSRRGWRRRRRCRSRSWRPPRTRVVVRVQTGERGATHRRPADRDAGAVEPQPVRNTTSAVTPTTTMTPRRTSGRQAATHGRSQLPADDRARGDQAGDRPSRPRRPAMKTTAATALTSSGEHVLGRVVPLQACRPPRCRGSRPAARPARRRSSRRRRRRARPRATPTTRRARDSLPRRLGTGRHPARDRPGRRPRAARPGRSGPARSASNASEGSTSSSTAPAVPPTRDAEPSRSSRARCPASSAR